MINEAIDLYAYFGIERGKNAGGFLTVYARGYSEEMGVKARPAMLIIPGGGYNMVSEREGEPVALRFLNEGYAAFLLQYSVRTPYPAPLIEAGMAMAYIRKNARSYSVDPAHVAAVGFSAGGHLAGMLATLFGEACLKEALGKDAEKVRPDAVILSYPVISTLEGITHEETAENISGGDKTLRGALSLDQRVKADCPPAFIWHTAEDDCVPVVNALLYAGACGKAGVPFELHIFEKGRHGLSVADRDTERGEEAYRRIRHAAVWTDLALTFLRNRGFCVRSAE